MSRIDAGWTYEEVFGRMRWVPGREHSANRAVSRSSRMAEEVERQRAKEAERRVKELEEELRKKKEAETKPTRSARKVLRRKRDDDVEMESVGSWPSEKEDS